MLLKEKISNRCLVCEEKITGRRDKKFCDDHCRANYHHQINEESNKLIRKMNNRLKKNRSILKKIDDSGEAICSSKQLSLLGFDFSIHTSIYINELGVTFYYCYDIGYVSIGNDFYSLVKRNKHFKEGWG
jgi:hypothetical protein